jgi:hypothetical protein
MRGKMPLPYAFTYSHALQGFFGAQERRLRMTRGWGCLRIADVFVSYSEEHFSRALLPLCGMRASAARGKEGTYSAAYPALSRLVPRNTRDQASRAGLTYSAPLALVCREVLCFHSLKCPSGPFAPPFGAHGQSAQQSLTGGARGT